MLVRAENGGRLLSSVVDLRKDFRLCEREAMTLSRGLSLDLRNFEARLMKDVIFLGPATSSVGAVVVMAGPGKEHDCQLQR